MVSPKNEKTFFRKLAHIFEKPGHISSKLGHLLEFLTPSYHKAYHKLQNNQNIRRHFRKQVTFWETRSQFWENGSPFWETSSHFQETKSLSFLENWVTFFWDQQCPFFRFLVISGLKFHFLPTCLTICPRVNIHLTKIQSFN